MFILQLAWRNIWRYPKRTLITAIALAITTFALVFMLSFQIGSYDTMKAQSLKLMDGYGQLQHPDFKEKPSLRHAINWQQQITKDLEALQIDGLKVGERLQGFGLFSYGEQNVAGLILGVRPEQEAEFSILPKRIVKGRFLTEQDSTQVVIGLTMAEQLGVDVGQEIQVITTDQQGSVAAEILTVVGLFDSGIVELDRQMMLAALPFVQSLFVMPNQIQQLVLVSDTLPAMEKAGKALTTLAAQYDLAYHDWVSLQPGLKSGIELDFYSAMVFYVAILLIVVLILFNTILMSLLEREKEFGLMLSLGFHHRQLFLLVVMETQLTLVLGLLIGVVSGTALTLYYIEVGITIPGTEEIYKSFGLEATLYPTISWFSVMFAPVVLWLGGIVMSLGVVMRLNKLTPLSGRQE